MWEFAIVFHAVWLCLCPDFSTHAFGHCKIIVLSKKVTASLCPKVPIDLWSCTGAYDTATWVCLVLISQANTLKASYLPVSACKIMNITEFLHT